MHIFTKSSLAAVMGFLPTVGLADFTGGYAGIAIGAINGDGKVAAESDGFDFGLGTFDLNDDTSFSGFAGYQMQDGNLVYGGEIVLGRASDGGTPDASIDGLETTAVDIKGRVGYVFEDRFLAYGTAGFTQLTTEFDVEGVDGEADADGFIVGVGVDYLMTDNIVLGAEFTRRQVEGALPEDVFEEPVDIDLDVNTFELRASFKF